MVQKFLHEISMDEKSFFQFFQNFGRNFWPLEKFLTEISALIKTSTTYFDLKWKYSLVAILCWFEVWGEIDFFEKKSHKWKISKISAEISASKNFHFLKFFKVSTVARLAVAVLRCGCGRESNRNGFLVDTYIFIRSWIPSQYNLVPPQRHAFFPWKSLMHILNLSLTSEIFLFVFSTVYSRIPLPLIFLLE